MSNIAIKPNNLTNIILNYIDLLVKSENLHTKLENLYNKYSSKATKYIYNQIVKLNNVLNEILVKIMNLQLAINAFWMPIAV